MLIKSPLAASRDLISFLTCKMSRWYYSLLMVVGGCILNETYFPDFNILISVLSVFTHFEGVVGAGGVRTEVDYPPLTSQALKVKNATLRKWPNMVWVKIANSENAHFCDGILNSQMHKCK